MVYLDCIADVVLWLVTETILDTYHNNSWDIASALDMPRYYIVPPSSSGDNGKQEFFVDSYCFEALSLEFNTDTPFFRGSVNATEGSQTSSNDIVSFIHTLDYIQLEKMMAGIAASMTLTMRTVGSAEAAEGDYPAEAEGVVWQDLPFVHVRWGWLTLPILLVASIAILLTITIISNLRNDEILWKGSVLAPLLSSVDGRYNLAHAKDLKHVEQIAKEMKVKWERTGEGYRLVQI